MRALTTRWMPAAAATGSRPSRRPTAATARSAAATSSVSGAAGEARGVEVAEHDAGVGHRRLVAAAAVAGRARARRRRCAAPRAGPPAASIHAMLPPPAPMVFTSTIGVRTGIGPDRALAGEQRPAVPHQGHVVAGAAHVERDEVAHPGALGRERGADHAAGRPREEERDRLLRGQRRRHDAAARAHDQRHAGHAEAAQRLGEPGEVALHHRAQVGVEGGHAEPLVLAEGRVDLRRERDADLRAPAPAMISRVRRSCAGLTNEKR